MREVNSVEDLKKGLEADEAEMIIKNRELSKYVHGFKAIAPHAAGILVGALIVGVLLPLGAAAALLLGGGKLGIDVRRMLAVLGKEHARKLYYSYSYEVDSDKNGLLKRKF